jgi:hypothetical protein
MTAPAFGGLIFSRKSCVMAFYGIGGKVLRYVTPTGSRVTFFAKNDVYCRLVHSRKYTFTR